MGRVIRFLAEPRLALGVIGAMILFAAIAVGPPAAGLGAPLGEHPFATAPFLGLVVLLFLSTLSCTWLRGALVFSLWSASIPMGAVELSASNRSETSDFLHQYGFRGKGNTRWRNRFALGAGWLFHVGLLMLMAGVGVQLAWHDSAAFEVAVGETAVLSAPGTVFNRSNGPLAPPQPPDLRVELVSYDPHLHQDGYAPDRKSRLRIETASGAAKVAVLDRVQGVTIDGTTVFQVMPAGLALIVEAPEFGLRAIHLQTVSERHATASINDPAGESVRVLIDGEHALNGRRGTGALTIRLGQRGRESMLHIGEAFPFGGVEAKLVDVVRWSGFTYSRSPGMPGVFAGFSLVLIACTLLTIPAGVARLEEGTGEITARVWLNRGGTVLKADWDRRNSGRPSRGGEDSAPETIRERDQEES